MRVVLIVLLFVFLGSFVVAVNDSVNSSGNGGAGDGNSSSRGNGDVSGSGVEGGEGDAKKRFTFYFYFAVGLIFLVFLIIGYLVYAILRKPKDEWAVVSKKVVGPRGSRSQIAHSKVARFRK